MLRNKSKPKKNKTNLEAPQTDNAVVVVVVSGRHPRPFDQVHAWLSAGTPASEKSWRSAKYSLARVSQSMEFANMLVIENPTRPTFDTRDTTRPDQRGFMVVSVGWAPGTDCMLRSGNCGHTVNCDRDVWPKLPPGSPTTNRFAVLLLSRGDSSD